MKKTILIGLILLFGLSYQSFAKAGIASDEREFVLFIIAFLLFVAGIFEATDYLKKNGKTLFIRVRTLLRNKMLMLKNSH